jgi:hypothetical protein
MHTYVCMYIYLYEYIFFYIHIYIYIDACHGGLEASFEFRIHEGIYVCVCIYIIKISIVIGVSDG